jgi:deoxycytidylate deaminase
MEVDPKIHKAVYKATLRSTHKRHMTGCVIVKKNKIVSNGCAHASSFRLNELASIHAEIHTLARGRHEDLNGAIAYIMTIARKSGNYAYSAPCLTCAIALRSAGIRTVIFTNGENHPMKHGWNEHILEDQYLSGLKVYPKRKDI